MKQTCAIPLARLRAHPLDPFKPYATDKLRELAQSIAEYGLFEPIIVRPAGDGTYEILAGKNRANATGMNGDTKIDAFVYDLGDDDAKMVITDSNLKHRDQLLPSERGFAYRLQLEALKQQGKKRGKEGDGQIDATSDGIHQKLTARKMVAEHNAIKQNIVQQYIYLTNLIPEILALVDSDFIPVYAGIDLSFLDEASQQIVYRQLFLDSALAVSIDLNKSAAIKQLYKKEGTFTEDSLRDYVFQSRGVTERVIPIVNRKMLKGLTSEVPLPDDETLLHLFAEFLLERFKVKGTLEMVVVAKENFY
jgi:ParB family chromosome partitioning protein